MYEILTAARRRAGLVHATCHELRHACLTSLREAGIALEAVQAQAGHVLIESTRIAYASLGLACPAADARDWHRPPRLIFRAAAEFRLQASTAAAGSVEMTDHCQVARRMIGYRMSV